jgi:uncharacterized membrane protein YcaP (DUF421 family)
LLLFPFINFDYILLLCKINNTKSTLDSFRGEIMDFFSGQETLSTLQWILRAIIGFFFLILIAKIMGERSISQLRFLDFVMALLIGNIIAHPLSDEGLGLKGSMISMSILVFLYLGLIYLSLKWHLVRKLFDPAPFPLIENGQIHNKNLFKARITVDILLGELRKEKVDDVKKVALALWESDGKLSIFLDSPYQNVTSSDLKLTKEPFDLPKSIIKDGRVEYEELQRSGKDEQWLINQLNNSYNVKVKDVLLATIDKNENVNIFLYK